MWYYGISQSQQCDNNNKYDDDNVMHACVSLEFFGGLFLMSNTITWSEI